VFTCVGIQTALLSNCSREEMLQSSLTSALVNKTERNGAALLTILSLPEIFDMLFLVLIDKDIDRNDLIMICVSVTQISTHF